MQHIYLRVFVPSQTCTLVLFMFSYHRIDSLEYNSLPFPSSQLANPTLCRHCCNFLNYESTVDRYISSCMVFTIVYLSHCCKITYILTYPLYLYFKVELAI